MRGNALFRHSLFFQSYGHYANRSKYRWAEHVMRCNDGRWSKTVIEWYSCKKKRPHGRPPTGLSDSPSIRYNIADDRMRYLVHWSTRAQTRKDATIPNKATAKFEARITIMVCFSA
ncbi:hypothetical protein Y032_0008g290 [Ancylostoma ceylanicum]|uniref:Uncharacterized protein n=1 Tax=Ancylostoma ceylanicum TaxID=53326 RepID=A0A016VLY2_9BILA|nr:hypothetical protein Y032_0008g290 [Ancylostoma ceylanicum]